MEVDLKKPVEIAEETFWVGHYIESDIFQCHTYLIRNGKESVLIDPGSLITFKETLRKVKYLVDLGDIKYIVCHHQDPDVVACLPELEKVLPEKERYIVTHWRTYFLLKHYNLLTPFYLVDQHGFKLSLGDRELQFILTPYMHYAGNIVTYDPKTKVLFSSDIFGGWVEGEWTLFAKDENYIESVRSFHEIYMPCKEVVLHTVESLKKLDVEIIAPQHGSIIKGKELVEKAISALLYFDYGKMFEADVLEVFKRKLQRNSILSLLKELALKEIFLSEILKVTFSHLSSIFPLEDIVVAISADESVYVFSKENGFFPKTVRNFNLKEKNCVVFVNGKTKIAFILSDEISREDKEFLKEVANIFFFIARREEWLISLKEREKHLRFRAYRDVLTGLYRREFLEELVQQEFYRSKRYGYHFSVLMIDIDNFKQINDKYGHLFGDKVLRTVAGIIRKNLRKSDIAVRYGGEEFLVVLPHTDLRRAAVVAERIRKAIEETKIDKVQVTVSIGVADNSLVENFKDLIQKADSALYKAKRTGKNKVVICSA